MARRAHRCPRSRLPSRSPRMAAPRCRGLRRRRTRTARADQSGRLPDHLRHIGDALNQTVEIANPGIATYLVSGLSSGTWYFAVKAYSRPVREQASNVASKTIP